MLLFSGRHLQPSPRGYSKQGEQHVLLAVRALRFCLSRRQHLKFIPVLQLRKCQQPKPRQQYLMYSPHDVVGEAEGEAEGLDGVVREEQHMLYSTGRNVAHVQVSMMLFPPEMNHPCQKMHLRKVCLS
jgi:hypothetical protein